MAIHKTRRSLKADHFQSGRRLAEEIAGKNDPKLKDLTEIYIEVERAKIKKYEANNIRSYLNLNRQYSARFSPLNISLIDKWHKIEKLSPEAKEVNEPNCIFKLIPTSVALVTVDFRHVMD
jgi:hypothetical protein